MEPIRDDIPAPLPNSRGHVATLRKLVQPGQSVLLPISRNYLGQAIRMAGLVGKYTARAEPGGMRIWRTKE
jgi:hypothetical protein